MSSYDWLNILPYVQYICNWNKYNIHIYIILKCIYMTKIWHTNPTVLITSYSEVCCALHYLPQNKTFLEFDDNVNHKTQNIRLHVKLIFYHTDCANITTIAQTINLKHHTKFSFGKKDLVISQQARRIHFHATNIVYLIDKTFRLFSAGSIELFGTHFF